MDELYGHHKPIIPSGICYEQKHPCIGPCWCCLGDDYKQWRRAQYGEVWLSPYLGPAHSGKLGIYIGPPPLRPRRACRTRRPRPDRDPGSLQRRRRPPPLRPRRARPGHLATSPAPCCRLQWRASRPLALPFLLFFSTAATGLVRSICLAAIAVIRSFLLPGAWRILVRTTEPFLIYFFFLYCFR